MNTDVTASGAVKPVAGYFVYVAFRVELEGTHRLRCSHIMHAHCPKCIRVGNWYYLRVSVECICAKGNYALFSFRFDFLVRFDKHLLGLNEKKGNTKLPSEFV